MGLGANTLALHSGWRRRTTGDPRRERDAVNVSKLFLLRRPGGLDIMCDPTKKGPGKYLELTHRAREGDVFRHLGRQSTAVLEPEGRRACSRAFMLEYGSEAAREVYARFAAVPLQVWDGKQLRRTSRTACKVTDGSLRDWNGSDEELCNLLVWLLETGAVLSTHGLVHTALVPEHVRFVADEDGGGAGLLLSGAQYVRGVGEVRDRDEYVRAMRPPERAEGRQAAGAPFATQEYTWACACTVLMCASTASSGAVADQDATSMLVEFAAAADARGDPDGAMALRRNGGDRATVGDVLRNPDLRVFAHGVVQYLVQVWLKDTHPKTVSTLARTGLLGRHPQTRARYVPSRLVAAGRHELQWTRPPAARRGGASM
jgi:hypothetical protein